MRLSDARSPSVALEVMAGLLVAMLAFEIRNNMLVREELKRIRLEKLNNTRFADQEGLVFNRVPKVN